MVVFARHRVMFGNTPNFRIKCGMIMIHCKSVILKHAVWIVAAHKAPRPWEHEGNVKQVHCTSVYFKRLGRPIRKSSKDMGAKMSLCISTSSRISSELASRTLWSLASKPTCLLEAPIPLAYHLVLSGMSLYIVRSWKWLRAMSPAKHD